MATSWPEGRSSFLSDKYLLRVAVEEMPEGMRVAALSAAASG